MISYPYPIFTLLSTTQRVGLFTFSGLTCAISTMGLKWLYGKINGSKCGSGVLCFGVSAVPSFGWRSPGAVTPGMNSLCGELFSASPDSHFRTRSAYTWEGALMANNLQLRSSARRLQTRSSWTEQPEVPCMTACALWHGHLPWNTQ
jgi:hypothetical protein